VESPTYTLVLTEAERKMLIFCMGAMVPNIRYETIRLLTPDEFNDLAVRLIDSRPDKKSLNASSGTDQARAILSPPAQVPAAVPTTAPIVAHDRWARDRHGNELPNPEGCVAQAVRVWKVETKKQRKDETAAYVKVTWESPTGVGYVDGNCFDAKLHPWLIRVQGTKTTLYTVRNGDYLNVVGVRA